MSINLIVQARMGSTRFPGKVMQEVDGKPLIGHLMDRLECVGADVANRIVVMPLSEDDALFKYVDSRSEWYAAPLPMESQADLAGSFSVIMQRFPADSFCRICGDSPLIDPADVAVTINEHVWSNNLLTFGGYPHFGAVECVNYDLFKRCLPKFDEEEREHVTLYFTRRCKLTVDYPQDLDAIRGLFKYKSAQECINALAARL